MPEAASNAGNERRIDRLVTGAFMKKAGASLLLSDHLSQAISELSPPPMIALWHVERGLRNAVVDLLLSLTEI